MAHTFAARRDLRQTIIIGFATLHNAHRITPILPSMDRAVVSCTASMDFYDGLRGGADKPQSGGAYVRRTASAARLSTFDAIPTASIAGTSDRLVQGWIPIHLGGSGSTSPREARRPVTIDQGMSPSTGWRRTRARWYRVVGWYDSSTVYQDRQSSPTPQPELRRSERPTCAMMVMIYVPLVSSSPSSETP
jgi:hypothetical protein